MRIGTPKETFLGESRVAMTPESARKLQKLGYSCAIESGAGEPAGFPDSSYESVGVTVIGSPRELWESVEIIAKVRPPNFDEVEYFRKEQTLVSFFYPGQNGSLIEQLNAREAHVIAMDMVPRISRAQKMDSLSSMANIAGYRAVIEASNSFGRFFTGQITAAGKVPPAKVLVIGAGVAGLAAIGTATSLGAITYAFDVRPEVAEQVESMGAEFVYLNFNDSRQDSSANGGYASVSSPEFHAAQLEKFREIASEIDIVITTALIPGRAAPELWTEEMVASMKPGSVIVDLAAERGGNCKQTVENEKIVTKNGVIIIGYTDLPSRMAAQSSTLFSNNIYHMLSDLTPRKDGALDHNMDDDVIRSATATYQGQVTYPPPAIKSTPVAAQTPKKVRLVLSPEEKRAAENAAFARETRSQFALLGFGAMLIIFVGANAPPNFMQHFIVFVLSVFIGFQVIWKISHALHTPLMAVTNAISGIIILGALLQFGSPNKIVITLAGVSILIATINIVGGFLVTRRMLQMFQKS